MEELRILTDDEIRKAATAARFYFIDDFTQKKIAELMNTNQSEVSRYVNLAREHHIIHFSIKAPMEALEKELKDHFPHLRDVVIVPLSELTDSNGEFTARALGLEGAQYFLKTIGNRSKIGISCGNTLNAVVRTLGKLKTEGGTLPVACEIFSLNILMTAEVVAITPSALVANLVEILPHSWGKAFQLPSPLSKGKKNSEMLKVFQKSPEIQQHIENIRDLDCYLIAVGCIDPFPSRSLEGRQGSRPTHEFNSLVQILGLQDSLDRHGAKGESLHQPFNDRGESLFNLKEFDALRSSVLCLPLEILQSHVKEHKQKTIIAVAGGHLKHEAIIAALRAKIFNVLVTDSLTVEYVLKEARKG